MTMVLPLYALLRPHGPNASQICNQQIRLAPTLVDTLKLAAMTMKRYIASWYSTGAYGFTPASNVTACHSMVSNAPAAPGRCCICVLFEYGMGRTGCGKCRRSTFLVRACLLDEHKCSILGEFGT